MTLHRAKPLVFSALLLFISLSIAELSLRLLGLAIPEVDALIGPRRDMTRVIPHPLLGHVGNPEFFEHDARGFRNKRSVDRAHVVALGDSHTYGTGVDAADAWPSVLARQLDEVVYNMGLGGYGAAHNAENVMTALSLKPEHVVFALYPGNDFYDDFRFAMRNGRLAALTSVEEAEKAAALERD
ncbi:MAG: hypothetical protein P8X82_14905, partial [Gemmatimonadales bacterium]